MEFTDNISIYAYIAILYRIKIPSIRGMKKKMISLIVGKKSRRKESRYFHHFYFFPSAEIQECEHKRDYHRLTRNNKRNALLSAKLKMIVYKKR